MIPELGRYAGRTVEIVYIDKNERITRRTVVVLGIRGDAMRVYCCGRQAHRLFKLDRILAVAPIGRRMG